MTREEAIELLCAYGVPQDEKKFQEALDMAIKALEQEPVLDKIRAEIEKLRPNLRPEQMTDYDYAMADVVNDIIAIIDKYRGGEE